MKTWCVLLARGTHTLVVAASPAVVLQLAAVLGDDAQRAAHHLHEVHAVVSPVVELASNVDAVLEDEAGRTDAAGDRPPGGAHEAGETAQTAPSAGQCAVVRLHVSAELDAGAAERTETDVAV